LIRQICWRNGYSAFEGFPVFFDITLFFQLKSDSGPQKDAVQTEAARALTVVSEFIMNKAKMCQEL
jgi:hypothetical protein